MGNCISWESINKQNNEEKLCKEIIKDLKNKRKNQFNYSGKSKRKLKFQTTSNSIFFEDDSLIIKSSENTRDTFFTKSAKSATSFYNSSTKIFYPQVWTKNVKKDDSFVSQNGSRHNTPEKKSFYYSNQLNYTATKKISMSPEFKLNPHYPELKFKFRAKSLGKSYNSNMKL